MIDSYQLKHHHQSFAFCLDGNSTITILPGCQSPSKVSVSPPLATNFPSNGTNDVFVHISAVERAGMGTLTEGQTLSYDVVADRRTGKSAAENLRAA